MTKNNIDKFLQVLTPAEILFLNNPYKIEISSLLRFTVIDLLVRNILVVEEKPAKYSQSEKAFFLCINYNNLCDTNLTEHEKIIISKINSKNWVSLIELSKLLSFYLNEKFRLFSKGFKYEDYVCSSLIRKGLIKKGKKFWLKLKVLFGLSIHTEDGSILSGKLTELLNYLLDKNILNFFQQKYRSDQNRLNVDLINKFINEFDLNVNKSLGRYGYVSVGIVELGRRYPEPLE